MAKKNEKGGGARKYDRNRAWCKAYRLRGQRERNKAKRLIRHIARFPSDRIAVRCFTEIPASLKPPGHR